MRRWAAIPLWQRVLAGLALGVLIGLAWPQAAPWLAPLGEIFVRLIRMLVAPIVLVTIAAGIVALGSPARLGAVGVRALALFLATTVCAVAIGMAVGLLVRPGEGVMLTGAAQALGATKTIREQLVGIVPTNIFAALADGDMLAIIFTAALLGIGTIIAGEAGRPVAAFLTSAASVLLHIVRIVMEFTPIGVLALVAGAVATSGPALFVNLGWLALCVVVGSVAQMALVHAPLVAAVARIGPRRFFAAILDALVVAFSTASSSATLPVAMRVAQDRLGVDRAIASTVLPLGASIGKDGTAMYVGLLAMFGLQAFGVTADLPTLATVLVAAVLAAFGTAPVPSASLFMLAAVLSAAGVAADSTALLVGFILPFDRLLDMTRTVPSASANLAVTASVGRWQRAGLPIDQETRSG